MKTDELQTPALLVDADALAHNLDAMAEWLPGPRLRPHVKAHKCSALARLQADAGHAGFTCATIREVEVLAAAGLGHDLLLANEVADARRLGAVINAGSRVTLAVDSEATIDAAVAGGVREVVIDVNVGLPRCGSPPELAGELAAIARSRGLGVRGVMGSEGQVVGREDRAERSRRVEESMALLIAAHKEVGGELVTAGGTGTYDLNVWATEIQAGSYALMDTAYGKLGLPFRQALLVEATVISVSPGWAVADAGLKAFGMDHGNPSLAGDGQVLFCSDEHVTFVPSGPIKVGERARLHPAHVDPTVAYHEAIHLIRGTEVLATWPVDMRGW